MNNFLFVLRFIKYSFIVVLPLSLLVGCDTGYHNISNKCFSSTFTSFYVGDDEFEIFILLKKHDIKAVIYPKKNSSHFMYHNDQDNNEFFYYYQEKVKMKKNCAYCFANADNVKSISYWNEVNDNNYSVNIDVINRILVFQKDSMTVTVHTCPCPLIVREAKNDATEAEIVAESQNDPSKTDANRE